MPFQYVEKWKPVSAWGKSMESYLAAQGIVLQVKYEMQSVIAARPPKPKKIKPIKIKPAREIKYCACGNDLSSYNMSGTCWTCRHALVARNPCQREGCVRRPYPKNKTGFCSVHGSSFRVRTAKARMAA